jgi:hypothetical protein
MIKSIDFKLAIWLPPVKNGVFPKLPADVIFGNNIYVCYDEDVSSPGISYIREWIHGKWTTTSWVPGKWSDPIAFSISSIQSVENVKPRKKKVVEMIIIRSNDFLRFQEQIREYLEKGYKMRGSFTVAGVTYYQMMVKKK